MPTDVTSTTTTKKSRIKEEEEDSKRTFFSQKVLKTAEREGRDEEGSVPLTTPML